MTSPPAPARLAARPDASMAMLTDLLSDRGDEAYVVAARRRSGDVTAHSGRWDGRTMALTATLAIVGAIFAVGAVTEHAPAPGAGSARAELVSRVSQRTKATDELQRHVADLRAEVSRNRSNALNSAQIGADAAALAASIAQLERVTGIAAMSGAGVTVTLDDRTVPTAAGGGANDPDTGSAADQQRLQDRDVQAVVNALWAAGATGIAINGQRLTSLSAIRSAAQAILVDYRPLVQPYVISVVGVPSRLEHAVSSGATARLLRSLHDAYGIRSNVKTSGELSVPAAAGVTLRTAMAQAAPAATQSPKGAGP